MYKYPLYRLVISLALVGCLGQHTAFSQAPALATRQVTFTNPIAAGQDPSVVRDGSRYLWCQSREKEISIYVSDTLTRLGDEHLIWEAPANGPYSRQVWAPELTQIAGRWYIYFAASDGLNENHLSYVLASKTSDPLGEYELHGPLYTGSDYDSKQSNLWAIDMTVMLHDDRLYAIWSGWTTADSDIQCLYIAPMTSPTHIAGDRVMISPSDTFAWERVDETESTRGLNEGPAILQNRNRTFLVYSASASWLPSYKVGMFELIGDDPLDPASWKKWPQPVFQSTPFTFGVGHGCFTTSPDGTQWWHVYHAKDDRDEGWKRSIFIQPLRWTADGAPLFGQPVRPGERLQFP